MAGVAVEAIVGDGAGQKSLGELESQAAGEPQPDRAEAIV